MDYRDYVLFFFDVFFKVFSIILGILWMFKKTFSIKNLGIRDREREEGKGKGYDDDL